MLNNSQYKQRNKTIRIIFFIALISLLSLCLFTAGSEAATYYVQPDNTSNIGVDGTCNVASGQVTTAPIVRTTFDAVGNGATGSSYRPTTGMSNGNWTVLMRVYGPVYSANAVDISAVTAAKFSIRGYNASDQWTFHLYAYNPAGAAGNKTLVATSQTITSGTGGTVAVNPTYTISGTGRVPQNNRLLLEIAYRPGGTTYTPRVYYDTTGGTTESYVTVTETPVASGDTLTVSGNTAIASANPTDGTADILMQRFQLASNNVQNGQVELTSLNITDSGNASGILNAKVYISTTSSSTLPAGAVLIGSTGAWNGNAAVVTLNSGTTADRTVTTGTPKFIYIVYDLSTGQVGNTIQSSVTGVVVAAPDISTGNVGTSSLLTIQPCSDPDPSTITIPASQTAYGNPYEVSGMFNTTGDVSSFEYKITTGGGTGVVSRIGSWISTVDTNPTSYTVPAGTSRALIVAVGIENSSGTVSVSNVTFGGQPVTLIAQRGDGGTGYNNFVWFGYCNEACITAAGGGARNIQVTSSATLNNIIISAGTYQNVNQTSPAYASGTNVTTSSPISVAVNNPLGGRVLFGVNFNGQTNSLNALTGYTEMFDTPTGTSGAGNGFSFAVAERDATTAAAPVNITATASATSSRTDIVAISLNPAAGETICTSPEWSANPAIPTSGACAPYVETPGNYNLYVRGTDPDCGTQVISSPVSQPFTWNSDGTAPTVTAFTATTPSTSLNIPITSFTATDNTAVTGYIITASATPPSAGAAGWTGTAPATYTVATDGTYTLYPWAKDAAGNVSAVFATPRTVVVDTVAPTVSSTVPTNGATGVALNGSVTINWSENVNCTTVNTTNITSTSPGWTLSTCANNQAVFTTGGQANSTLYSVTVTTAVRDANNNPMAANNTFSYTTVAAADLTAPSSAVTTPANGATLNSASANPFTISGTATDNVAVSGIEVSTNGGSTWNTATCTGCPGANVTWSYSWTLPADGSYTIRSRATDSSSNVETPAGGNTVTVDRTAPAVSSTVPVNGAAAVALNSSVTINWSENVNCATVNTTNITINNGSGFTLSTCSNNQAVFTTSSQTGSTAYTVTVSTAVTDANGNPMAASYPFSYTTTDTTAPTVTAFTATTPSTSLNIPVTSFTASDNISVTGYMITTSSTAPLAGDAGWTGTAPATYTVGSDGTYTLYPWAKDAAGNVSAVFATPRTVVVDTAAPTVSSTVPTNGATSVALNSSVTINWNENVNCTTVTTGTVTISPAAGWTRTSCGTNQAVFTPSGQAGTTTYTITVTTGVTDANGNPMTASYPFSYTTADAGAPVSSVTTPANGATLNSASANPFTISGTATDNVAVSGIEVSTNGGSTWNTATCTGCPGANVTWSYSWTLPADGSYTIRSRSTDSSSNVETPAGGNTVTVDRTAPAVSSTVPVNGAAAVALNSSVTINWSENLNCATVNTTNITINNGSGWTLSSCSGNQAVFTTASQSGTTTYTVTVTTAVRDTNNNPIAANYLFSFTTADVTRPSSIVSTPANGATLNSASANPFTISGTASDNVAVSSIEVSTNGGTTWNAATCTGCPGANVTWSYSWTLPADGSYNLKSRATDATSNVETPGAGNTVTIDRTAPTVSSTVPANGATNLALNSSVTINWNENVNCTTVTTGTVTISPAAGWTRTSCGTNQAVFTPSGQAGTTTYTITVTTGVTDANGNPMAASYPFSYTTTDITAPTVTAFTATTPSTSLNIPVTSFTATDNVSVTGYKITSSATPPLAGDADWSGTAPATYTVASDGTYTLYPWAKDAAGNVSAVFATPRTVVVDTTAPTVSSTVPVSGATGAALNSTVTINWSENVNCTTVNTTNITINNGSGWTLSTCSGNQAVFTANGQAGSTTYTVTVTTAVRDINNNPMAANYQFSYSTVDTTAPSSAVTVPANGAVINSVSANPFTISGSATDNVAVSSIQVSTNGGTTWNAATCTGCPGANVTWSYSWTLPADGSYNVKSRATDSTSNVETPGAGNTVTVDRTAPTVSSTIPATGATNIALNSTVTINWSENVNCTTVTTANVTISPAVSWTMTSCSGSQAIFTPAGQAGTTTYTVTATTGVRDANNNPMAANFSFSYTTADAGAPSSTITTPANGATLNSASANPFTISGTASDNVAVSSIEVSTNGGATWNNVTCTGCPGANVTWTYSWTLPADGSYNIKSRATDSSSNVETLGAGNTILIDRTAPSVSNTSPANGTTGAALNGNVTITWSENVNCSTVNTTNITSTSPGWTFSTCSTNQAVFTTSGQAGSTLYSATVTTGVRDANGNAMSANYSFSYTTSDVGIPVSAITTPANGVVINNSSANPLTISGTASDNIAVSSIQVSTNGGTTWNAATCTGCPGANVTWTYSWTLPADGTYTIRSRATDSTSNVETPAAGNNVTVDRTAPTVSSTVPTNGATAVALNSNVTVVWSENVDCTSVTTSTVTISPSVGWTRSSCSTNQAVFTPSGQASMTVYSVTATTGVRDANGNAMSANYSFSYTTADTTVPVVTSFAATSPSTSLNIPITAFTATDNVSVTGYIITTSSTPPSAGAAGWTGTAPATYTVATSGSYTLYPWAKDAADNVSAVFATPRTVIVDTVPPTVTSTEPANAATGITLNSTVTMNWPENVDCTTVTTSTVTISPAVGWTRTSCSAAQAVFTPSGQAGLTAYTVTVSTGVRDSAGNQMAANYTFSYTTGDVSIPVSAITTPANGAVINSASADPFTISGSAADNVAVSGIEVSTNGGTSWNTATCTGCPGANVTWTYSWTLPADGSYNIKSRATDSTSNVETPGAGNTVTVDRTAPTVSSTVPVNGATAITLNSNVTINWSENVDCTTVNTTNITTSGGGLALSSCANNQAVFTTSGQSGSTIYTVTVGTGVKDARGNAMAANFSFSYTTADMTPPASVITAPANGAVINSASANPFTISGTAADNVAVSSIQVSTNGGTSWNTATCTGCPGANVTWTYSWTLPADGSYNIRSRATDSSANTETPGTGNTVTIDRTAPTVSSTVPVNTATNIALNSNITITWSENVNCTTVNTTNITISGGGLALSSCANNQAVFTTSGQTGSTTYSVTVTTGVRDTAGNAMAANYSFSYTTVDVIPPSSVITVPSNGAVINSASANPFTISGTAADNLALASIEVSTNGGTTWNPATCTGCPGTNVTWTYSWTLPADGSYNIRSRARDASGNTETPATGNTVTIDRTAPTVSATAPVNGASNIAVNSSVTITWSENVNCTTVNTANITISSGGWTLLSCSANQAVFTTSGQAYLTTYTVTATTGVRDMSGNAMTANYSFSYTTETPPNSGPSAPTGLAQYKSNETTVISQGRWTNETTAVMKGTITDPDGNPVQLQVEVQPSASAFTGTPNCTSGPAVASNSIAKATCSGLVNGGQYKWQARAIDSVGGTSIWIQYGSTDPDVSIDTIAPTYTWNTPASGAYYKNGSVISVDATITESGSGLLNGTDCTAKIDGASTSFTGIVIYYPATGKCTGTLTLNNPSGLINGAHSLTIQAPDIAGNSTQSAARAINIDNNVPVSAITAPANGAIINGGSPNPYTISGTASDNTVVSGIEVSTNGGTTWSAATCTGCPGANVTWTYSWTLPADGSYNIKSRAIDSANNIETPGAGNSVTVDRTAPSVSVTQPLNGATGAALNGNVTITWNENVNCTTVTTANITISSGGWAVSSCSGNQAVFTTGSQAYLTTYTVTVRTAVRDLAGNSMAANYTFSYTTTGMNIPVLSYPSSPYDNGLDPDTGDTRTTFTFRVIYRDYENDAPASGYPMIYIGDNDGYYGYTMNAETPSDVNYTDGKTYYFTTGFGAAQDLRYFFEARAATGNTNLVNLPATAPGYQTGPAVYLLPGYNLVGVPKNLSCNCNTYTSVLGDDSGYQYCLYWDSYGPDPAGGGWLDNTYGMLYSGRGYDIYSDNGARRLDEPAGTSPMGNDLRTYVDIVLDCQSGSCNPAVSGNGGWSVISNPYNAFIELRDVMVVRGGTEYSYTQAVANGWISNSIYEWEGAGPGYAFKAFNGSQPAVLEPWVGYFIHVFDATPTTLRIYAP